MLHYKIHPFHAKEIRKGETEENKGCEPYGGRKQNTNHINELRNPVKRQDHLNGFKGKTQQYTLYRRHMVDSKIQIH